MRRFMTLELIPLAVAVMFFSCLFLYLQPYAREIEQSTTVATTTMASDQSAPWSAEERADVPKKYRLMHLRCKYSDPINSDERLRYIQLGRVPLLFIHGNAGTFDTAASLASLLPLGKWPAVGVHKKLDAAAIPALGMTVFSVDLNEDANIQSGNILARQAKFVVKSVRFLHRRFVAYHLSASRGHRNDDEACASSAVAAAFRDFAEGTGIGESRIPKTPAPLSFCKSVWHEVDAVQTHGIWVVGHSMGGIVARLAVVFGGSNGSSPPIAGIISLNSPHRYPPIILDSVMAQLYVSIREHWADEDAAVPPVTSIHAGAMDEQVFFETTRLLRHHHSSGVAPTTSSIYTGHMVDCGMMFDHNSVLWSLELMEPLAEAIWRMQRSLYAHHDPSQGGDAHNRDEQHQSPALRPIPGDLMLTSLVSVFPPRRFVDSAVTPASASDLLRCSSPQVNRTNSEYVVIPVSVPQSSVRLSELGVEIDEQFIVFAPLRARACVCLELAEGSGAAAAPVKQWQLHAAIQSPLLQTHREAGTDRLATWSLFAASRKSSTAAGGNVAFVADQSCVDDGSRLRPAYASAVAVSGAASFVVARGSTVRMWLRRHLPRQQGVGTYCVVAPKTFFDTGTLTFSHDANLRAQLASSLEEQALEEAVQFFRISDLQPYIWRSFAAVNAPPMVMQLLCQPLEGEPVDVTTAEFVHIEHVHDASFQWANIMVVYESGPMLLFCSLLTMASVAVFLPITPWHHPHQQGSAGGTNQRPAIRAGWIVSLVLCVYITSVASLRLGGGRSFGAPWVVPLTASAAGCGLGLALCIINLTIQRAGNMLMTSMLSPRAIPFAQLTGAFTLLVVTQVVLTVERQVYWPLACWIVLTLFLLHTDRDRNSGVGGVRGVLTIALIMCFHASGSIFYVKNHFLGSDFAPLAPEYSECVWLLLVASIAVLVALPVAAIAERRDVSQSGGSTPRGDALLPHRNQPSSPTVVFIGASKTAVIVLLSLVEYSVSGVVPHNNAVVGHAVGADNTAASLPQYWEMARCALCTALVAVVAVVDVCLSNV